MEDKTLFTIGPYKDYWCSVIWNGLDGVWYGRVYPVDKDLVMCEADALDKIESEFHKTVDDYAGLKSCNLSLDTDKHKLSLGFRLSLPFYRLRDRCADRRCRIKTKRQRAKRGWADEDAWNIDRWFIATMLPMLQSYRTNTQSWDDSKWLSIEEYRRALDHLILLLHEMKDPIEDGRYDNSVAAKYRVRRKDEFFRLFSDMFYGLWD